MYGRKRMPQSKLIGVNDKLGNTFLKKMQGTTKMIYDTLPLDGRSVYEFFKETQTRSFPDTNIKSDALPVAESLSVQRASISKVVKNSDGEITAITSLSDLTSTELPIQLGELSVEIANDRVMKPITLQHFLPEYNKDALNETTNIFEFNTDLIIPPQLSFQFNIQAPAHSSTAENLDVHFLRIVIEGVGAQFSAKGNF